MHILIVEDSPEKREAIRRLLLTSLGQECLGTIENAESVISAVARLKERAFDLLILDLVLPIRDSDVPKIDSGAKILEEIYDGVECKRPTHIICLTADMDAASAIEVTLRRGIGHLVYYDPASLWINELRDKVLYVKKRIADVAGLTRQYCVDLVLITSSPEAELAQVLRLPGSFAAEYCQEDSVDYYLAEWITSWGKNLRVVACAAPVMGMTAACCTTMKAISRWSPKYIAMCGIAAGTRPDMNFGDVLVAEAAYDYGSGKIHEGSDGVRKFLPSPVHLTIDDSTHAVLQRCARDGLIAAAIERGLMDSLPQRLKVVIGMLASGAAVVQSDSFLNEVIDRCRKVVGIDMEAYGVFHAARLSARPKPRVVVAKSISDFGDNGKNNKCQALAAYTSACFMYQFFTSNAELWD